MSTIFPVEVETEILIRVPIKSLLRFRRVCRRWRMLISNPSFIRKHLSLTSFSPSKTLVRFYSKTYSKEIYRVFNDTTFSVENSTRISYPFNEKSKYYFRIVGYCDGVLCLSDDLFGFKETIILWNPSIKRAITVSSPKTTFKTCGPYYYALGFGYDGKNDDYKVVRVAYLYHKGNKQDIVFPPRVEVYSVMLDKWTCLKPRVTHKVKTFITENNWSQAVYDSVVHWVGYKRIREKDADEPYCHSMMTFDLKSDKFGELDLPFEVKMAMPTSIHAKIVRGLFSVLYYHDFSMKLKGVDYGDDEPDTKCSCVIWVMMEYGNVESWAKCYTVKIDGGLGQVLGMKRGGEIVCCGQSGELVAYNFRNMTTTSTGIFGTQYSFFADDYVESLVLLGKGKEVRGKKLERDYEKEDVHIENLEFLQKGSAFTFLSTILFSRILSF